MGCDRPSNRLGTALFFNDFNLGKTIATLNWENTTWTSLAVKK
jgi:hypothetical protein